MPNENNRRKATSPLQSDRNVRTKGDICQICKSSANFGVPNDPNPAVLCSGCGLGFHTSCGGISDNLYFYYIVNKKKPWFCYICNLDLRDKTKGNYESISKIENVLCSVNTQMQSLSQDLQKIRSAESSWNQELESRLFDEIDDKIDARITKKLENKVESLVTDNVSRLLALKHPAISVTPAPNAAFNTYRKNIIITCVPECEGENIVTITRKIAKQVNFLQDAFIDNCFRIDNKQNRREQTKPSSILLKCTTEMARDNFLRCYFNYIKNHALVPKDIGLQGENRIYLNEHLSPELQPLLKKALTLRRENRISQVASHCTHLSIKFIVDNRPVWKRIHNEEDLNSLLC